METYKDKINLCEFCVFAKKKTCTKFNLNLKNLPDDFGCRHFELIRLLISEIKTNEVLKELGLTNKDEKWRTMAKNEWVRPHNSSHFLLAKQEYIYDERLSGIDCYLRVFHEMCRWLEVDFMETLRKCLDVEYVKKGYQWDKKKEEWVIVNMPKPTPNEPQ